MVRNGWSGTGWIGAGRWLVLLLFWSLSLFHAVAAAEEGAVGVETVRLYPDRVMWGRPVTLSVPTEQTGRIDWAPIERCFARKIAQAGSERVRYRLYARQPGTCGWPAQKRDGQIVLPAARIEVLPHARFQVDWTTRPAESGWVRQGVNWQVRVIERAGRGEASSFRAWLENPPEGGLRYRFSDMDEAGHLRAIGWPLQTGKRLLEGPMLVIREDNGRRWHFPGPRQVYRVRPLPMWMPQDVPVGRLAWQVDQLPRWALRDDIVRLSLRLEGEGVWPDSLSLPLLQNRSFPEEQVEEVAFIPHRTFHWENGHPVATLAVEWALKMNASGIVQLPALSVLYFDPQDGRLHRAMLFSDNMASPEIRVVPGWMLMILGMAGMGLTIWLLMWVGRRLWQLGWDGWLMWQYSRCQRHPDRLWYRMQQWARWRSWPRSVSVPITPRQWWKRLPARLKRRWQGRIEELEEVMFGRSGKKDV